MLPARDVDEVFCRPASIACEQGLLLQQVCEVACGGRFRRARDLAVFFSRQATEKSTVTGIEQLLEGLALTFIERVAGMGVPVARFLKRLVNHFLRFDARGGELGHHSVQPGCDIAVAFLGRVQGIVVSRPVLLQLTRHAVKANR